MEELATQSATPTYAADYHRLVGQFRQNGQAWLAPLRDRAMQRFLDLGWPTLRDEAWRFTDVRPITQTPFVLAEATADVGADAVAPFSLGDAAAAQLVFVDGQYRDDLSSLGHLPEGVIVQSLADAIQDRADATRRHLGQYADFEQDAFTALNTAFLTQGLFVLVPAGVTLDKPIHALYVATSGGASGSAGGTQPLVCHPRNLVIVQDHASACVIEHYVSLGDGPSWSNTVTEAVVGANAHLAHYVLELESQDAFNIQTLRVDQGRDSRFESHTALLGGALVRNNIHVELTGEGCNSLVNGLFVGRDRQHLDNHMRIVHAAPHCDSRQFYKGVLADKSHGVFSGRIVVNKDAQKTDAKQTNRNLLLSDEARINTQPQLEIYADDVKCTHGATTGQLDEEALFYLQARGIPTAEARQLLIHAFAAESLGRMTVTPVRELLERVLAERLA
ncbi:MAG: Fe-S cluster assembly protein SufD [Phycisphaeraceae bacterium]